MSWYSTPPAGGYRAIDARARPALRRMSSAPQTRSLIFPELTINQQPFDLASVDGPSRYLHLVSGRLPRTCTARRCEVLQVGTVAAPKLITEPGLRLVRVGVANVVSPLPLPGRATPPPPHGGRPVPFLLSNSTRQLSALPVFSSVYRSYGWSAPAVIPQTHIWSIDSLLATESHVAGSLTYPGSYFNVSGPDLALLAARQHARVAEHRLLLIGGGAAALVLAFVLLAAVSLRRDAGAEWSRLDRRGALWWQRWLFLIAEGLWITAGGAIIGYAIGCAAVALVADRAGLPAGPILRHSLLDASGLTLFLVGCFVALAALLIAERFDPRSVSLGAVRLSDLVAVLAIAAVVFAAVRGRADSADLTNGDPLLPLLIPLICLAAGALAISLVGPFMRLVERGVRNGPLRFRLAALWLSRGEGRAPLAVAYLVVAIGLAVFALSYAATLSTGEHDQAAYKVPGDLTVTSGPSLVQPLEAAPMTAYSRLAGSGGYATPVLRRAASSPVIGLRPTPIEVLGVSPAVLPRLAGWRGDDSSTSISTIARRLRGGSLDGGEQGPLLPVGARTIGVTASARGGVFVVEAVVQKGDGPPVVVRLGSPTRKPTKLQAALPAQAQGGRLVGLELVPTFAQAQSSAHQSAEGGTSGGDSGTATIDNLQADGTSLGPLGSWIGRGGLRATPRGTGVRIGYILGHGTALVRPREPTDGRQVPLLVSPDIAAAVGPSGKVELVVDGEVTLEGRVAAVARRFPTLPGSFAVADEAALQTALNGDAPGVGQPLEVWIGGTPDAGRSAAAALSRAPYQGLDVASRTAVQSDLHANPLSRGITVTLVAAAGVAGVLALLGVLLGCLASLRDERADLFDLETQGVTPDGLRGQLRVRALVLVGAGLIGGIPLGILLSWATTAVVVLGAGGGTPRPPLLVETPWLLLLVAAVGFVLVAELAVWLASAAAFREPVPRRATGLAP